MIESFTELAAWELTWLWWWAKDLVRDQWNAIPGPRWVKIIVITIIIAALIVPGQIDEIIIIALVRFISWLIRRWQDSHQ